ncbi:hypothetical protein FOZ63_027463 [Perkinsus olseni]|uniref:Transmembrane protein n=1 Tax=Perkinsus olseni TaxID=32597 RepID=A0A7J6NGR7_PEROL|nr:hypothetical protein FOZ63_027463 [Perkinsus olseni]
MLHACYLPLLVSCSLLASSEPTFHVYQAVEFRDSSSPIRRASRHSKRGAAPPPERVAEVVPADEAELMPVPGRTAKMSTEESSVRVVPITVFCIVVLSIAVTVVRLVVVTKRKNAESAAARKSDRVVEHSSKGEDVVEISQRRNGDGDDVVIDDELNACSESTSAASDEEPTAAGTPSVNVSFDQDL